MTEVTKDVTDHAEKKCENHHKRKTFSLCNQFTKKTKVTRTTYTSFDLKKHHIYLIPDVDDKHRYMAYVFQDASPTYPHETFESSDYANEMVLLGIFAEDEIDNIHNTEEPKIVIPCKHIRKILKNGGHASYKMAYYPFKCFNESCNRYLCHECAEKVEFEFKKIFCSKSCKDKTQMT